MLDIKKDVREVENGHHDLMTLTAHFDESFGRFTTIVKNTGDAAIVIFLNTDVKRQIRRFSANIYHRGENIANDKTKCYLVLCNSCNKNL